MVLAFMLLAAVCKAQDYYTDKFSTGSNTGWYKLATFDLNATAGCCNSANVNAKIHYINTWTRMNFDVQLRFRQHKTGGQDVADWQYTLTGNDEDALRFKKIGPYLYELWGLSSANWGHFAIELYVTKENNFGVTTYSTPVQVTNLSLEDVGFAGAYFLPSGNVHIGTLQHFPEYQLVVDGKAIIEEVNVKLSENWPDYVFAEDYDLPSLESIRAYIKANQHLPEIPPAEEMEENGIDIGVMNMLLLKKIEELTLYIIRQNEALEALKDQNKGLEKRIIILEQ